MELFAALYYSIRQNESCSGVQNHTCHSRFEWDAFRSIIVMEINFPEEEIDDLQNDYSRRNA